jgi:hypothetical protein
MTWRWEGGIELDGSVRFRRKTSLLKQFINRTLIQVRSANFILLLFFQLMRLLSSFSQRLIEQFLWKWPVHSHQYHTWSTDHYCLNLTINKTPHTTSLTLFLQHLHSLDPLHRNTVFVPSHGLIDRRTYEVFYTKRISFGIYGLQTHPLSIPSFKLFLHAVSSRNSFCCAGVGCWFGGGW